MSESMPTGPNYESLYHEVMECVRKMEMPHGACDRPRACTHCMGKAKLSEITALYRGRKVSVF